MTMKQKMLRGFLAALTGFAAATAVVNGGGLPGSAASCQRSIAIDPQVTVSEASRTLTFVVHTNSCAQPGSVIFEAFSGSAQSSRDFLLDKGQLTWAAGDLSPRRITAAINDDDLPEQALEEFTVRLTRITDTIRIASPDGQGRIFDNDTAARLATTDNEICLISRFATDASCLPTPPNGTSLPAMNGPVVINTIEPGHMVIAPIVLNVANAANETIRFDTFSGGLVENLDFVPVHKDILIPAGVTVVLVEIELKPHAYTLPGQSFYTQVSNYTAGAIPDPTGTVTMLM